MQSSAIAAPTCVEPAPASQTRMEEELAAPSTSTDKTDSMDVDGESKKLLGLGQKHLVMGNIPAAVNAFQEAASLLGKKYGETADECAEAFFYYGKSLLELARMENGVLGNALEGVQVEEGEKAEEDSALPAADEETREELREQVYNAMGEKEEAKKSTEESTVHSEKEVKEEDVEMKEIKEEPKEAAADKDAKLEEAEEKTENSVGKEEISEEQKKQMPVKEEAAVEEKEVEEEQKAVPEDKVEKAAEEEERTTEVSDKEAKAAGEEAEAGEVAVEEKGETGEQAAEATEKEPAEEKGEAVEGQAETAVEEKAEAQAAAAVEQKETAEGDAEVAEQKKAEEKHEPVEAVTEEKPGESKEIESSREPVPLEGKEPPNDMEEKTEVAAKVEKEEKKGDLMEEGEGAKVEKEEKDDLMEEGEETEESEEEDKENDKADDDKENELTVEDKESEEDEIGNLELAWDMLELAKVIYKRQETKEAQLHAAQAHLKLGEVSIESENYTQAIEEFQACLALQQKYLEAHDRLLAESHYQLALAYHYNSDFDEAVLQFGKSMEVIDKRLAILTERIKKADTGSPEDEKEIEELKGLLPEIKEKIEDSKESQKSAKVAELGLKATLVGTTSGFAQSEDSGSVSTIPVRKGADAASQCVTDISHLVRKKRKPEEETHQGDNEAKKSKPEPAVNGGGGDSVPRGNEVAEKKEEETEKRPQAESGAAVESTV
ncbi:nuclear autoantigenic sperm protein isoform X1 [Ammospiza caudacuta]|uniref:nuclear autoantigenic sperm protein isoform X1 n=1 Tax=Ammospiza caudacuta TaxID=2857398 RepID=UPI002738B52D|nr:nuclear autoantigenic sperm protein isoform X1 [Ammospiza caudacuta]